MKRVPGHPLPGQMFLMEGRRMGMMMETFLARWTMRTMKTRQERMTGRRRTLRKTRMVTQLLMRRTWTMICDYQIIFILTISKYRPEIDNQN